MEITVYTDGSCHTQLLIGAWAAILFINGEQTSIKGVEPDTTHNRMELMAVIKSIEYLDALNFGGNKIQVYSDSQYVVNLCLRMDKLQQNNFVTKAGKTLQNADLLRLLIQQIKNHDLEFIKIKAHQQNGDLHNREVDMMVRNLLRENIKQ